MLRAGALRLLLRRGLRRQTALAALTGHDTLEQVVTHTDRRRRHVRRAMLRRAGHAGLGSASASLVQLATEQDDLFVIPAMRELGMKSGVGPGKKTRTSA